ncbi:hypothetical protein CA54_58120 [Symmachiella macrocystis]|uniref:Uncharacterized protein n=1 Tax=Symmachiella macrocystis TaxID=2527985 RepID=A0A5C6B3Q2_9PLAN|nr:hypothetical protein CA54_58120 [Symmachiella macrocystis]
MSRSDVRRHLCVPVLQDLASYSQCSLGAGFHETTKLNFAPIGIVRQGASRAATLMILPEVTLVGSQLER